MKTILKALLLALAAIVIVVLLPVILPIAVIIVVTICTAVFGFVVVLWPLIMFCLCIFLIYLVEDDNDNA